MKSFLPIFFSFAYSAFTEVSIHVHELRSLREISTFSTIFKLNKVHQYNIFSTSHNRWTFLPLHDLSRKPIYKVCFKIQSTVDRHDFVSRSHNSFAFWCLPDIKSMLHEYWQRECLPVYLGNMHNYASKELGFQWFSTLITLLKI